MLTLTGSPSLVTGPRGQKGLNFTGAERLVEDGTNTGEPWTTLSPTAQFWLYAFWDPKGFGGSDNTFACTGAEDGSTPGFYMYGSSSGGAVLYLCNGSSRELVGLFDADVRFDYQNNSGGNTYLFQVDRVSGYVDCWINGFHALPLSRRTEITNFTGETINYARALTIGSQLPTAQQNGCNGDLIFAMGNGLLAESEITHWLGEGKGIPYGKRRTYDPVLDNVGPEITARSTSVRVVGSFTSDPVIELYDKLNVRTLDSLVATSGAKARGDADYAEHEFTGLTADTEYGVRVKDAEDNYNRYEYHVKTLPATIDDIKLCILGCADYNPEDSQRGNDGFGLRFKAIFDEAPDLVCWTGDKLYLDTDHVAIGGSGNPSTLTEFLDAQKRGGSQRNWRLFMNRFNQYRGSISDHDLGGDDVDSNDSFVATGLAFNRAATGLSSYPGANLYRTVLLPGLTFISLDLRTEFDPGSQMTSSAQRTQLGADVAAAAGRGDYIVLFTERPFNAGLTPVTTQHWNDASYATEKAEIETIFTTNSMDGATLIISGDYHALGVDRDASQQWGTVWTPPCLNAAKFQHVFGESVTTPWPDYFDNKEGGFFLVTFATVSGTAVDVTLTPYELGVAQTAITEQLTL